MSRTPFDPGEIGRDDADLRSVAEELERYAATRAGEPAPDLAARIHAAIDDEPERVPGWWASIVVALGPWRGAARMLAAAAVLVAVIVGVAALGELVDRARLQNIGASPAPSEVLTPSPSPSLSPSPSATPSPSPSPTPTPTVQPTTPSTPAPTATDDDFETPEPSDDDNSGPGGGGDDDFETPEPSDDDNSGPGGGDD